MTFLDFRQILKKIFSSSSTSIATNIVDEVTGYKAVVNSSGQLKVVLDGKVDTNNSSTAPLLANDVYIGTATDTLDYALLFVTVYSNVASATNGLCLQISSDGITWRDGDCYTVPAGIEKTYSFQTNKKYIRIRYINGVINQTTFDLHVVLKKTNSKPSSHRIQDSIINDDDATLTKSVITGRNPAGTFVNFEATTRGNFKCSIEELENDISVNSNTQLKTTTYNSTGTEVFVDGTDIGDVTINNGSGANAVNIQDGGNSLTVDQSTHDNLNANVNIQVSNVDASSTHTVPTTTYDSSGNEGQVIIGTNYISGKSGIDASSEAQILITYEHHEIHDGNHYNYCDYTLNQAAGAIIEFILTTPNTTEWTHFTFGLNSSTGATIDIYEGASGITGGTTITPRNNNRNSSNTSNVTIVKDPTTITSDGVRASGYLAGGDKEAGFTAREKEYILKQNTIYLLRVTSLAVSNDISWCADWYEHTNKN